MHWKNWVKLIGVALLVWILSTLDLALARKTLIKLNPAYLMGYVLCFVAMIMVRTLRLKCALSCLGYPLSFLDCYVAILEPAFMGSVTPGRFGEFTRVGYIHAHGISMLKAVSVVTIERLVDISVLLIFGVGGMVYIFASAPYHFSGFIVILFGLILFNRAICSYDLLLMYFNKYMKWMLRWEPAFVTHHRQVLATSFHHVMTRAALPFFSLALACIALNFIQIFFLAKSFGFEADYLVVIFAYAVATLVSLLPISVAGLGTREATYIMIMAREGILKDHALLFSLIDGVVLGIFGLMILFIPILILKYLKI